MNKVTHQVLSCIAEEVLGIARSVLDEKGMGKSSIKEKIEVKLEKEQNPIVKILFKNYVDFIENGYKSDTGKIPSIADLRDWVQSKGLSATNDVLYAIANAIRKDGIDARPILSVIYDRLDKAFDDRWADELFHAIVSELDLLFE